MRLSPGQRRALILDAAVTVALDDGILSVTHETVAERVTVDTSAATVRGYYRTLDELRRAAGRADTRVQRMCDAVRLG